MFVGASITGALRTVAIIIGVIVLLRFLGQLMAAKKNIEEERKLNEREKKFKEEKKKASKNLGKTNVIREGSVQDVVDVDHEELD